jgi:hypothetical protein
MQNTIPTSISTMPFGDTSNENYRRFIERIEILAARERAFYETNTKVDVSGDGLVVPSWLALCWIVLGSGFESRRRHLFFGISPRGEVLL